MDEVLVRIGFVLGAIVVAAAVAALWRWRSKRAPRWIDDPGFEPGVYLFTSESCPDCLPAREKLFAALGETGVTEIQWEEDREIFKRLEIREVPATLVVDDSGRGRLWPGQPKRTLLRLGG